MGNEKNSPQDNLLVEGIDIPQVDKVDNNKKRKRPSHPEKWQRYIRKNAHQSGQAYIGKGGKYHEARKPLKVNCNNCRYRCFESFTEEQRITICNDFWALGDYRRKKDFIAANIKITDIKRRSNAPTPLRVKKGYSLKYSFKTLENVKKRVCRDFFVKTLNISAGQISEKIKLVGNEWVFDRSDNRGKHAPTNKKIR